MGRGERCFVSPEDFRGWSGGSRLARWRDVLYGYRREMINFWKYRHGSFSTMIQSQCLIQKPDAEPSGQCSSPDIPTCSVMSVEHSYSSARAEAPGGAGGLGHPHGAAPEAHPWHWVPLFCPTSLGMML